MANDAGSGPARGHSGLLPDAGPFPSAMNAYPSLTDPYRIIVWGSHRLSAGHAMRMTRPPRSNAMYGPTPLMISSMAEGLIRKRQGLGAFVTEKAALARRIPRIGFEDEVKQVLEETQVRVLSVMRRPCSATAAAALGISESEEALHVLRVRSRKRVPLMYLDSWIPLHSAGRVTKDALRSAPLYLLVAGSTENIGRIAQQVSASLADPIIASALKVEVNSAVLRVDRVVHRSDGTPIQFLSVWATPERSRLVMELSVTELSGLHGAQLLHDVGRPS